MQHKQTIFEIAYPYYAVALVKSKLKSEENYHISMTKIFLECLAYF